MKEFAPGIKTRTYSILPKRKKEIWEFVIQKHLADKSGLHYDIRFGDPKKNIGYSFVSKKYPLTDKKTLAIQTFDHSLPYFDFEGKIKKGYGKGLVKKILRTKIEIEKSSPKRLIFSLDGQKYGLINTKDKNWLLFKLKDSNVEKN